MDGVLVIDKPAGPTSHDVVASVRRVLAGCEAAGARSRPGRLRVGHTGTLDPLATGVLPLVIGKATRLARFFGTDRKEYVATIMLGFRTDTFDLEGEVLERRDVTVSPDEVAAAVLTYPRVLLQQPPAFSAKKIAGRRAYRLARTGERPTPHRVQVAIEDLEICEMALPKVTVRLVVSAGFYVRSFAEDLGQRLGTGGCLERLRRTRSGTFTEGEAVPLATLLREPQAATRRVVPLARLLPDLPSVVLTPEGLRRVRAGQDIGPSDGVMLGTAAAGRLRLVDQDGQLVAIAERVPDTEVLHPALVLG